MGLLRPLRVCQTSEKHVAEGITKITFSNKKCSVRPESQILIIHWRKGVLAGKPSCWIQEQFCDRRRRITMKTSF